MTAMALMRLLPDNGRVERGSVLLDREELLALPESRMRERRGGKIGIIFQDPSTSLNPVLRIGDQITETIVAHTAVARRGGTCEGHRVADAGWHPRARTSRRRISVPDVRAARSSG